MDAYDIQTSHLEALQAIAREGSFARAASSLGFSQAAISQQVARLEACVGMPVLDRPGGRRPATLTPAGRVLLRHADHVLARVGALEDELEDLRRGTGGHLRCGVFQSVGVQLLPEIVRRVRAEAPDLAISVTERDANEELVGLLVGGELDLAFVTGPLEDDRLDLVDLGTDPYVVLLPLESPLGASGGPVPATALKGVPLIGQHDCSNQAQIDDALRRNGVTPRYLFRTNDNGAVQAMVRSGIAPAVMPALAVDREDAEVRILPVDGVEPRTILIAMPAGAHRVPSLERFVATARQVSRDRIGQGSVRRRSASSAAAAPASKRGARAASVATT